MYQLLSNMDSAKKGAVKKQRIRKFQLAWLDENVFKGWLAPHPTLDKALCTVCNKAIRCKLNLIEHYIIPFSLFLSPLLYNTFLKNL